MAYQRGLGLTPGYTPAQQAMADAFKSQFGGGGSGPAVFVEPNVIPTPACASDTQPGGAAFSDVCQQLLQKTEQQNMQLRYNANYNVDLQNCLNQFPQPPDCYSRTFGLTPTGGYTSDAGAGPKGSTLMLDAAGHPVGTPPPAFNPAPNAYVAPSSPLSKQPGLPSPLPTPLLPVPASGPAGGSTQNYVTQATDFLTGGVAVAGSSFPIWGLVAAGAALLLLMGGKH